MPADISLVAGDSFSPMPVLRPREQVQEQIRQAILSGHFGQGDRLPSETDLASRFRVSRATVREALRGLVESGLITKVPGASGGSFVEHVDHHALSKLVSDRMASILDLGSITHHEVAEFRNMLEVPSARLAAMHRTESDLQALREVIDGEKASEVTDPIVAALNAQFHTAMAAASKNRVLAAFVAALHRVAHPLAFIDTDSDVGRQSVRHHIELFHAIEEQDSELAADVMRKHLQYLDEHAARASLEGAPSAAGKSK